MAAASRVSPTKEDSRGIEELLRGRQELQVKFWDIGLAAIGQLRRIGAME